MVVAKDPCYQDYTDLERKIELHQVRGVLSYVRRPLMRLQSFEVEVATNKRMFQALRDSGASTHRSGLITVHLLRSGVPRQGQEFRVPQGGAPNRSVLQSNLVYELCDVVCRRNRDAVGRSRVGHQEQAGEASRRPPTRDRAQQLHRRRPRSAIVASGTHVRISDSLALSHCVLGYWACD